MKRLLYVFLAVAALGGPLANACDRAGPPPHRGPPAERLQHDLGLTDEQSAKVQEIFEADRERMQAAMRASREQTEKALADVLDAGQLAKFRQSMQHHPRHDRRGPPPGPPPSGE